MSKAFISLLSGYLCVGNGRLLYFVEQKSIVKCLQDILLSAPKKKLIQNESFKF
jgi:hypothetical protein